MGYSGTILFPGHHTGISTHIYSLKARKNCKFIFLNLFREEKEVLFSKPVLLYNEVLSTKSHN
jgi:hypothetical protein